MKKIKGDCHFFTFKTLSATIRFHSRERVTLLSVLTPKSLK